MANEVVEASVNDSVYTAIIEDAILREIRPMNVVMPFFRKAPNLRGADSYDFLLWEDNRGGRASSAAFLKANVETHTEAAEFTNRNVGTAKATVSATVKGIMASISDESRRISLLDVLPEVQGVLGRTMAEEHENTLAALLAGFSNVTDAGASMTLSSYLAVIAALEQRDITGGLVSVLHPKQVGQIRTDLTTQTGTYWGRESAPDLVDRNPNGYVTTLFSVPIYQTTLVPTSDAAANRAGAMFEAGQALGYVSMWDLRTELQRDASKLITEIVLSRWYGAGEIDDDRGQTIKSDV